MPRTGQNPMKWQKNVYHPERITLTTAVHIPYIGGYWTQSLEVLKLCLHSLCKNTRVPFDLMVLDNGSCREVQDYLLELYHNDIIRYLILSEYNLGKSGAWNVLFKAAQGEVVSYTDSDVYFLPGWLEASLKLLEAFPEAGMVTAQPVPGNLYGDTFTLEGVRKDPSISIKEGEDLIPQEQVEAHRKSLGRTPEEYASVIKPRRDVLVSRGSASAYVSASVFQFTTTKKVVAAMLPIETKMPMWDDLFDVDKIGYWRLSTTGYHVHHMGNEVPPLQEELNWVKIEPIVPIETAKKKYSRRNKILQNPILRRILKRLNVFTYEVLYREW